MQKFLMTYVKNGDDNINCSLVTSDDLTVIMSYKGLMDIHNIQGLPCVEDAEDIKQFLRDNTKPVNVEYSSMTAAERVFEQDPDSKDNPFMGN